MEGGMWTQTCKVEYSFVCQYTLFVWFIPEMVYTIKIKIFLTGTM